jgi:hypothetical protein
VQTDPMRIANSQMPFWQNASLEHCESLVQAVGHEALVAEHT